jgi:hypothetical protein
LLGNKETRERERVRDVLGGCDEKEVARWRLLNGAFPPKTNHFIPIYYSDPQNFVVSGQIS